VLKAIALAEAMPMMISRCKMLEDVKTMMKKKDKQRSKMGRRRKKDYLKTMPKGVWFMFVYVRRHPRSLSLPLFPFSF